MHSACRSTQSEKHNKHKIHHAETTSGARSATFRPGAVKKNFKHDDTDLRSLNSALKDDTHTKRERRVSPRVRRLKTSNGTKIGARAPHSTGK
jgi:hypothetical protein